MVSSIEFDKGICILKFLVFLKLSVFGDEILAIFLFIFEELFIDTLE